MKETYVAKQEEFGALIERVISLLLKKKTDKASVILLEGDLGAGKTTFTQHLAKFLGVDEQIHSPTFILKKEYKTSHSGFRNIIHIDAYRFNSPNEAKVLRLEEDLKNKDNIIAIEWPSKMTYIKEDMRIVFSVIDENTREISLEY